MPETSTSSGGSSVSSEPATASSVASSSRVPTTIPPMSARYGTGATRSRTSSAASTRRLRRPSRARRPRPRVVPVAGARLVEGSARPRRGRREADGGDQLPGLERRLVRAAEELPRGERAAPLRRGHLDRRVERDRRGRQLGPRRRIGERAADRAAMAGGEVADVPDRLGEQRPADARPARPRAAPAGARARPRAGSRRATSIAARPATPLMSTSADGLAVRNFISGTRLWPPASTRTPSPRGRAARPPPRRVVGAW